MPNCSVASSGTRPTTCSAIASSTGPGGARVSSGSGLSISTRKSNASGGNSPTPRTYGIDGLTCAMTSGALRTASITEPTATPRLCRPSGPAGLAETSTASTGTGPSGWKSVAVCE